jgi:hypothetical protein
MKGVTLFTYEHFWGQSFVPYRIAFEGVLIKDVLYFYVLSSLKETVPISVLSGNLTWMDLRLGMITWVICFMSVLYTVVELRVANGVVMMISSWFPPVGRTRFSWGYHS